MFSGGSCRAISTRRPSARAISAGWTPWSPGRPFPRPHWAVEPLT